MIRQYLTTKEFLIFAIVLYSAIFYPRWTEIEPELLGKWRDARTKFSHRMSWSLYVNIYQASMREGIDPNLTMAVIKNESNFKNIRGHKINKNGTWDRGIMQINECHLSPRQSPKVLYNPFINISIGTRYLARCVRRSRRLSDAIRKYNQGLAGRRDRYNRWWYVIRVMDDYMDAKED